MSESTYLFAIPTWAEGAGRLVDFGDTLNEYNYSITPDMADAIAIAMDWRAVGVDVMTAVGAFGEQLAIQD